MGARKRTGAVEHQFAVEKGDDGKDGLVLKGKVARPVPEKKRVYGPSRNDRYGWTLAASLPPQLKDDLIAEALRRRSGAVDDHFKIRPDDSRSVSRTFSTDGGSEYIPELAWLLWLYLRIHGQEGFGD